MSIPTTFFGSSDSLYIADHGETDVGNVLPFRVRTRPVAPAGASFDCVFDRFSLAVTWFAQAAITVTPVVDDKLLRQAEAQFTFKRPPSDKRQSQVVEHVMRHDPYDPPRGLALAPRGTWISFQIESPDVRGPGRFVLDRLEVEWELARSSKERV